MAHPLALGAGLSMVRATMLPPLARTSFALVLMLLGACSPFAGYHAQQLPEADAGHATVDSGKGSRDAATHDADAATHDAAVADAGPAPVPGAIIHIASCEALQAMAANLAGAYLLDADLHCAGFDAGDGAGFKPVGDATHPFTGKLDGRGHTISGVSMLRLGDVGLFGVTLGAVIEHVAISDVFITGNGNAGVVAGRATKNTLITSVFVSGSVTTQLHVAGGAVGELSASRVENSHANVVVTSNIQQAGLLVGSGLQGSKLVDCYANGSISGNTGQLAFGASALTVTASFFDCTHATGCSAKDPSALSTTDIQTPARFVVAGWDYKTPVWGHPAKVGAPCLIWEAGCSKYTATVTHLKTCSGLQAMSNDLAGNYQLDSDIDCAGFDSGAGVGFTPVGSAAAPFVGTFDGRGHSITGLRISGGAGVALFGATQHARIERVAVTGATVTGASYAGVLVGRAGVSTLISQVFVRGSVGALDTAGGIAGELSASRIEDSHASVSVAMGTKTGLLVGSGSSSAVVIDSYAVGNLPSGTPQTMLVGGDSSGVAVTSSFFDCEVATNCGAPGQTPQALSSWDMSLPAPFVYAGWDYDTPVWGKPLLAAAPCLMWEAGCQRYTKAAPVSAGNGSMQTPYLVSSCGELQAMGRDLAARYLLTQDIECGGFDVGDGQGFKPIGSQQTPFRGSFSGSGHTIHHLRIVRPQQDNVGLFGWATDSTLSDVALDGAIILGRDAVGAVLGTSEYSTINGCSLDGSIGARTQVGPVVGVSKDGQAQPACTTTQLLVTQQK